jgi:hypothetical protein
MATIKKENLSVPGDDHEIILQPGEEVVILVPTAVTYEGKDDASGKPIFFDPRTGSFEIEPTEVNIV